MYLRIRIPRLVGSRGSQGSGVRPSGFRVSGLGCRISFWGSTRRQDQIRGV